MTQEIYIGRLYRFIDLIEDLSQGLLTTMYVSTNLMQLNLHYETRDLYNRPSPTVIIRFL